MIGFARDYALDQTLVDKLHYCGYLGRTGRQASDLPLYERPFVLTSCGGGVDGSSLLEAFIQAAAELRPELGGSWLAVTGPLMPYDEHQRLVRLAERHRVAVRRVIPELRAHAALADCLVSMPGYNSVCDMLAFRRPAVFVPRAGPSREQQLRAQRLREWGLAHVVPAPALGAQLLLAPAIRRSPEAPPPPQAPDPLDGRATALD